ncbi:MAG: hypothetical protein HQM11_05370 [SAR324 cluster bacterium]|nr:hypothetical protein [SAR324 cluster bacterium]
MRAYKHLPCVGVVLLWCLTAGCTIRPDFPVNLRQSVPVSAVHVQSEDLYLEEVLCQQLKTSWSEATITCGKINVTDVTTTLQVSATLHESSIDFWRNTQFSLLSLCSVLLVTSSAGVDYQWTIKQPEKTPETWQSESFGRIGIWGMQIPVMGVLGTMIGSVLNYDKLPESLQEQCRIDNQIPSSANYSCEAYRRFFEDSLSRSWPEMLLQLQSHVSGMRQRTVAVTE